MADVRYAVTVDASGAVKSIEALDKAWEKHEAKVKEQGNKAEEAGGKMGGLWKQMAIGSLVARGVEKAFSAVVDGIKDSIKAAAEEEESENRLRAALETTGRSVEGNLEAYKEFAKAKMASTKYTHEEVEASATLLLQLTSLDQKGVKRAIQGAMGLSSVMGTDLHSATMMVTKAMEGNYTALQRVGIKVDENLTGAAKQNALLEKLGNLYPRAEAELNTFGGSLKQLGNYWDEVKESIGGTIVGNEDVRKAMKGLTEDLKKMVESDRFKLWLSSLTEVITAVVKGLGAIGKAIVDIEESLFGAKGWEEYVGTQTEANAVTQQGISIMALRRKALDSDMITVNTWREELKKAGGTARDMMKAISEGKLGPEMKRLFDDMKAGAEATKKAAEAAKPAINEVGNGLSASAKYAKELKAELKLVFNDELRAQLAKHKEALTLFKDSLSPKDIEELGKKIFELETRLGRSATDTEKVDAIFKELGVKTIPELAEATRLYEQAMSRLNALHKAGAIDELEYARQAEGIKKKLEENRNLLKTELPAATRTWIDEALRNAPKLDASWGRTTKSMADKMKDFGTKASAVMEKVSAVWSTVSSSMTAVTAQAQQNREIAIENEYKKRLKAINSSIKDEAKKQSAITALEAEFEIKRTSARAAGAKQAKAVALMEAIVNTASGVARAFKDWAFPMSAIIAGIVGGLGAVQIGLIAKQPIPLARGAVFTKPTRMRDETGTTYEMGEAGTEYLLPEKHLTGLLGRARGQMAGLPGLAMAGGGGTVININSPLVQTSGLSDADLERAGSKLWERIDREARRRGRK